ncbi:hypothetical protein [Phaeodactylibacter luteus]|uniref:Toxin-antitoxin system HicB family antitoxin n=1 Tax=Phaeodactylibacter luteus TaxID=1564516 RepID=A0A5C6RI59_9BACT|nr:hypothetical protein [Phaeodactylibacter luteus]TXB61639.1 hypothetical protein FRY97_18115 [Phaeodactylibacter luteus]
MVGAPSREGGRKEDKLSVRIEPHVKAQLKRLAFNQRLSLSTYIQHMVYRHLEAKGLDHFEPKNDTTWNSN